MTVETHLHRARERAESERASVAAKRDALDSFAARLRECSPSGPTPEQLAQPVGGGVSTSAGGHAPDGREQVRSAFAETVGEHTDGDAVLSGIQTELGKEAALALAPTTSATFTPQLQSQLLSQTTARKRELGAMLGALDAERESLQTHLDTVDTVVAWLVDADETPLTDVGFDALRDRHERLSQFRADIETATQTRQTRLDATTSHGGQVGIAHRSLVASLYEDFPVDYPVLATATRLLDVCSDAQQAVRAHLVSRA